jgi:hypothetical protein
MEPKHKMPWLAALLNLLLPGAGYLYIGKRKVFAIILMTGMVIGYFGGTSTTGLSMLDKAAIFTSALLFVVAFSYDAYIEALEANEQ